MDEEHMAWVQKSVSDEFGVLANLLRIVNMFTSIHVSLQNCSHSLQVTCR